MSEQWTPERANLWKFCVDQWRHGEWSTIGDDETQGMVLALDARLRALEDVARAVRERHTAFRRMVTTIAENAAHVPLDRDERFKQAQSTFHEAEEREKAALAKLAALEGDHG